MLDTVGIKHIYWTLPCENFRQNFQFLSRAKNPTWVFNPKGEKTLPNLTYVNTPDGLHHFSSQVSLPKMLFGHNARLPNQSEVIQGLILMAENAEKTSGLPFNWETATVSRIDYTFDVQFSDESEVWQMVEKLAKRSLKPLLNNFYEHATIYFTAKNKGRQVRIYPKLQEVLSWKNPPDEAISCAAAKLRFEDTFKTKSTIDALVKKYDLSNSKATTLLTENVSDLVITELLESLSFFELLTDEKNNFQLLHEHFPTKTAINLFGFHEALKHFGKNFYKNGSHKVSKSYYDRKIRDCRKAKIL